MRYFLLLASLAALISCTVLKPEGTWVRGAVWLVPPVDVRSAIGAACAGSRQPADRLHTVIVASRSELYVYFRPPVINLGTDGDLCVVVRKGTGGWRYGGFVTRKTPFP